MDSERIKVKISRIKDNLEDIDITLKVLEDEEESSSIYMCGCACIDSVLGIVKTQIERLGKAIEN